MQTHFTFHDATSGEFVSKEHAEANPDTTVRIEQHPNLGLATTAQIVEELAARVRVARTLREDWPNYTTMGD